MAFELGSRATSLGYRVIDFAEIGSTNTEALARARQGERGPLWLVTGHQTAGRGRRQRSWTSPPGNLAATVFEAMAVPPQTSATLGFAAGLALVEALAEFKVPARLKWPNDVLLEGAKLAGILLEAEPLGAGQLAVVVGIGVNVISAPQGGPYRTVSLRECGNGVSAEEFFRSLSDHWADFRALWADGSGMPAVRDLWLARAAGVGERIRIDFGASMLSGVFETIDQEGRLILGDDEGRRIAVSSGDVFFGGVASNAGAA